MTRARNSVVRQLDRFLPLLMTLYIGTFLYLVTRLD